MGLEAGTLHLHSCRGLGWLLVWFAGSGEGAERVKRDSGSLHWQTQVHMGQKLIKSGAVLPQLSWSLVPFTVVKAAGFVCGISLRIFAHDVHEVS